MSTSKDPHIVSTSKDPHIAGWEGMSMKRLARRAVLLAVAATLLVPAVCTAAPLATTAPLATAASSAPAPRLPAPTQGPATFGIRTANATAPDDRGRFVMGATAGAAIQDYVAVNNISTQPLTLRVYAADAFNTPQGGFDILTADKPSQDAGSWITLDRDSVTVPAGGVEIVPFHVAVPADAPPGDHAAGIVASLLTDEAKADGNRITVDTRVGTRVYLRVAGELRPQLAVEDVESVYHPNLNPAGVGSATVRYTVRNAGNLRLEGSQAVTVTLPWGSAVNAAELPRLPELLPGNQITVTAEVPDVIPAVLPTANVRIEPASPPGDIDPALPPTGADDSFWAVPWILLGIVALIVLLVLFRRGRRRRAARSRVNWDASAKAGA